MAIIIYTYTNPYKINHEKYWALIKNAFHLCVSQTLVNGLCDQYREFYHGKLTTVTRFINNLFDDTPSVNTMAEKMNDTLDQMNNHLKKFSEEMDKQLKDLNESITGTDDESAMKE